MAAQRPYRQRRQYLTPTAWELRMITKNHAADLEIGLLTKSISKPNGYATAMPIAWELRL